MVSAGSPGGVVGLPESCFDMLSFRNVTFGRTTVSDKWGCRNVQARSFSHTAVTPPFTGCTNDNSAGSCS